jgi:thiamine biosynthesis lipoprotein
MSDREEKSEHHDHDRHHDHHNHKNNRDYDIKITVNQLLISLLIILVVGIVFAFVYKRMDRATHESASVVAVQMNSIERVYPVMGTMATVKIYGTDEIADKAADKVQDVFQDVQAVCNIFDPRSEIARLNATAADKPFRCTQMLWDLLLIARRAYEISDGSFDITVKPLMDLWGFYRNRDTLPAEQEIKSAMKLVGFNKVIFNDKARTVKFPEKGMAFDLGGIAKGYAIDMAAEAVKDMGINSGTINLGGNIYCLPLPPLQKKAYEIGIRNPIKKDEICGTVEVKDQSVSTSGNYERYVIIGDKQYTHIIDPKKGLPVADMLAVTVITPKAVDADYLSTSIFINGPEFAEKIRSAYPRTSFLIISRSAETSKPELVKIGSIWNNVRMQNYLSK